MGIQEAHVHHDRGDPVPFDLSWTWALVTGWIHGGLLLSAGGGDRDLLMTWYRWSPKLATWSQLDLLLIVLGFGVFYLLARRN